MATFLSRLSAAAHALGVCLALSATVVLSMMPMASQAQVLGETLYDVYRLSSEARIEVDNDLMVATLVVQEEDADAAELASKVNATMSWAIEQMKSYPDVLVKSRDYQTYPRYENSSTRRLIGWRAQQSLELETDDFGSAGKAIQVLQERLQVQGIALSVKPATREKASEVLMQNALNAFKERAELVQRTMGSDNYRILDVDIQTENSGGINPRHARMAMESDDFGAQSSIAPAIVAGSSTVVVRVYGRIQLD